MRGLVSAMESKAGGDSLSFYLDSILTSENRLPNVLWVVLHGDGILSMASQSTLNRDYHIGTRGHSFQCDWGVVLTDHVGCVGNHALCDRAVSQQVAAHCIRRDQRRGYQALSIDCWAFTSLWEFHECNAGPSHSHALWNRISNYQWQDRSDDKYKSVGFYVKCVQRTLSGNYTNFGIFELYNGMLWSTNKSNSNHLDPILSNLLVQCFSLLFSLDMRELEVQFQLNIRHCPHSF